MLPLPTNKDPVLLKRILQNYGLSYTKILEPQTGYRNQSFPVIMDDSEKRNLILYKSEPGIARRIKNANYVSEFLHVRGFPVRCPVDERIICLRSGNYLKYGALYNYLPGRTIPWEAYTMAHIKLLGKTLSDMHAALSGLAPEALPSVAAEYKEIVGRMTRYFRQTSVKQALHGKLHLRVDDAVYSRAMMALETADIFSAHQALHMDFVRGNILFQNTASGPVVTGILDFEKTATGHPIFDIARTLAFLLVDCKYKTTDKVRKYFLWSGYNKRGQARFMPSGVRTQSQSVDLLEPLLDMFLLYDFYKFLRHNPYEYLPQNEHFLRTRNILMQRKILHI